MKLNRLYEKVILVIFRLYKMIRFIRFFGYKLGYIYIPLGIYNLYNQINNLNLSLDVT